MSKKEERVYGYRAKTGQNVTVAFLDGKTITGKLLFFDKFELYLEVKEKDVTIYKHAIKYIV